MRSSTLADLLRKTWESPVFGDSFNQEVANKTPEVMNQISIIAENFTTMMSEHISAGMPEWDSRQVRTIVNQIMPKAVSFCPALAAGEITNTKNLTAAAIAIGLMYWADQTMDRGDTAMTLAIELYGNAQPTVPQHLSTQVKARLESLQHITTMVDQFALPQDAPFVLPCFRDQVLLNEAKIYRLSADYATVIDKPSFIAEHAESLAQLMTTDAGFPSVSSSLYAIYRRQDPELPQLSEVYNNATMLKLLQICNAVVRLADELGDWRMDAGHKPEWGIFTINLFNQTHPKLVDEFRKLAGITDRMQTEAIQRAFAHFAEDRHAHGEFLMGLFFDHARTFIASVPPNTAKQFELYIRLCKRVLEIGHVNKMGDIQLGS